MQQAQWFESKKGYTVNFEKGRFTVFWTGDAGLPWRTVHNGHFSDGFKTVFDAVDDVELKAGEKGRRGDMLDLDPNVRQQKAEEDRSKREAEQAAKQNARQDSGFNRFRKAESEDIRNAFRKDFEESFNDKSFEQMFNGPFTNAQTTGTGPRDPKTEAQQNEWIKRTFGFDPRDEFAKAAEHMRQQQKQAEANAEFMRKRREEAQRQQQHNGGSDWFAEYMRRARGQQGQQREQAAPPRPQQTKRSWRDVLELPASGPLDPAAVKTQFRKLAMKHHPDREGGSTEKMAELNTAWDQACMALSIR